MAVTVEHRSPRQQNPQSTLIECKDVHKAFGGHSVLSGVTCSIPEGEITVIMGPSGTGKSVLLRHFVGLLIPDRGDVLVDGMSVPRMSEDELLELRRGMGMLFQDGALFSSMSLFDNVAFPLRQHTKKSEKEIREIVMDRLKEVGLAAPRRRCRTSSRAACASAPASQGRWSCSPRSCSSTSLIQAWIRCAPRCSAS